MWYRVDIHGSQPSSRRGRPAAATVSPSCPEWPWSLGKRTAIAGTMVCLLTCSRGPNGLLAAGRHRLSGTPFGVVPAPVVAGCGHRALRRGVAGGWRPRPAEMAARAESV